jgi:hypothetical protein
MGGLVMSVIMTDLILNSQVRLNVSYERIINLRMTRYRLLFPRRWIDVNVMLRSMTKEYTTCLLQEFYKLGTFHTVISFDLNPSGTSSITIIS